MIYKWFVLLISLDKVLCSLNKMNYLVDLYTDLYIYEFSNIPVIKYFKYSIVSWDLTFSLSIISKIYPCLCIILLCIVFHYKSIHKSSSCRWTFGLLVLLVKIYCLCVSMYMFTDFRVSLKLYRGVELLGYGYSFHYNFRFKGHVFRLITWIYCVLLSFGLLMILLPK